ncbi:hypothetical protein [Phenylobacterium conjunctum]|uniref:DUF968 domain-containing protein n=1 Tax=Phenylobacterium conjunctum TaxID=1298959 RepID=A0ABW3SYK6_9CAUL
MSLTPAERRELRDIDRRAKELRAKKDAEKKAKAAAERKARAKALVRTPGQRQPRERDPGYLAFLRRLPCIASVVGVPGCGGATQAAHLRFSDAAKGRRNPGLASKPSDRHATPLCRDHHLGDQHAGEERAFWNRLGVDPGDLSAALYAAYLAGEDGTAVLRRFSTVKQGAEHA